MPTYLQREMNMNTSVVLALLIATLLLGGTGNVLAQSASLPAGWIQLQDNTKNAVSFKKQGDSSGTIVKIYEKQPLEGSNIANWLENKLSTSKAPRGEWHNEMSLTRATANMAHARQDFASPDGSIGNLFAVAYSVDGLYVRLGVSISKNTKTNLAVVKEALKVVIERTVELEKSNAKSENRDFDQEISPPKVSGLKTGGVAIKPGRYVGTRNFKGTPNGVRYEIMLYENGEYEFLHRVVKDSDSSRSGYITYSQANGRLNLGGDFYNSSYHPSRDFCVYGINTQTNQHTIHAEEGLLTSSAVYSLVWVNAPDRLPPTIRKAIAQQMRAENGYEHTTAVGDGMTSDQIYKVINVWDLKYRGVDMDFTSSAYLLMNDGRVISSMPVAPYMLDVAKSRSRDPGRWGWWEKREDGRYAFSWNVDRRTYVIPKGNQTDGKPLPKGTRLSGTWQRSTSFSILDGGSTYFWGVHLRADGRFEKFNSSIMSAGGESSGNGPLVTTVSNNEKTTTVVAGTNVGGGVSSRSENAGSDRMGVYEFDGYNLTLTFDNGRVVHDLTFTTGENYKHLWFDGELLSNL